MSEDIRPIAMSGIHDKFYSFVINVMGKDKNIKILDIGAGYGAFSKRLYEKGWNVSACDLYPENFRYDKVECKNSDITKNIPYEDGYFDVIVAIEITEHIIDHDIFFHECNRVLKNYGKLLISTPNILSLKSRFRFLFSGFFYSFGPIKLNYKRGLQHISSITLDQYNYISNKNRFTVYNISVDKYQTTSKCLLWLLPFIYLYTEIRKIDFKNHNNLKLLLGRVLFIAFQKEDSV